MRAQVTKVIGYALADVEETEGSFGILPDARLNTKSSILLNKYCPDIRVFMGSGGIFEEEILSYIKYSTDENNTNVGLETESEILSFAMSGRTWNDLTFLVEKEKVGRSFLVFTPPSEYGNWFPQQNIVDTIGFKENRVDVLRSPIASRTLGNQFYDKSGSKVTNSRRANQLAKILGSLKYPLEDIRDVEKFASLAPTDFNALQMCAEDLMYSSYVEAMDDIVPAIPKSLINFLNWTEAFVNPDTIWDLRPVYCEISS